MIYQYAIIGGGISGIAIARLLQLSGVSSLVVLEANSEPGGLCRTRMIDGHTLDTGGGHFLCTKFDEVYDFVFHHIARDFVAARGFTSRNDGYALHGGQKPEFQRLVGSVLDATG